jgi:hypothetical protein
LVFEVGDDLFDDGVIAVLGLDERELVGAVGDEREVSPVGPQLGLHADESCAADDQPPSGVGGFRDLRVAFFGVVDALPGVLVDRFDGATDRLDHPYPDRVLPAGFLEVFEGLRVFQNPESARRSAVPVAPARRTRAISSSVKRNIPFCVFADPFLRRMCSASRVSARVARIGW